MQSYDFRNIYVKDRMLYNTSNFSNKLSLGQQSNNAQKKAMN